MPVWYNEAPRTQLTRNMWRSLTHSWSVVGDFSRSEGLNVLASRKVQSRLLWRWHPSGLGLWEWAAVLLRPCTGPWIPRLSWYWCPLFPFSLLVACNLLPLAMRWATVAWSSWSGSVVANAHFGQRTLLSPMICSSPGIVLVARQCIVYYTE